MTYENVQILAKWRRIFMFWQLGERPKGDPEADAVMDHRELTILLRAEVNALTALLVQKNVFTELEFVAQLEVEAELLNKHYEEKFPGITATNAGIMFRNPDCMGTLEARGLFRQRRA